MFEGLPNDKCQCPRWGYVIKGQMRVRYEEGEEVVSAGEAYYLPPGHAPVMKGGTEIVEFSLRNEPQSTMEAVERNLLTMLDPGCYWLVLRPSEPRPARSTGRTLF